MDKEQFENLAIIIAATILAGRKLSQVPSNSPAQLAVIADSVADARRILRYVCNN
jgi:hypothetical protein